MSDSAAISVQAVKLLREGRVQEADDLLSAAVAATEPAGPPPALLQRHPNAILTDILYDIHEALGSQPGLSALLQEFMNAHWTIE